MVLRQKLLENKNHHLSLVSFSIKHELQRRPNNDALHDDGTSVINAIGEERKREGKGSWLVREDLFSFIRKENHSPSERVKRQLTKKGGTATAKRNWKMDKPSGRLLGEGRNSIPVARKAIQHLPLLLWWRRTRRRVWISTMNVSTDGIVQEEFIDFEISALIDRTERFLQVEGIKFKGEWWTLPKETSCAWRKANWCDGSLWDWSACLECYFVLFKRGRCILGNVTAR